MREQMLQRHDVLNQHLTRFAPFGTAHDTRHLQLVHDASRPVIADRETALDRRSGTLLVLHDEVGYLIEHRIELRKVVRPIAARRTAVIRRIGIVFGQFVSTEDTRVGC